MLERRRMQRADLWTADLLGPPVQVSILTGPSSAGQRLRQKVIPEPENVPTGFTETWLWSGWNKGLATRGPKMN